MRMCVLLTQRTDGVVMGGADVVNYFGMNAADDVTELGSRKHAVSYQNYTYGCAMQPMQHTQHMQPHASHMHRHRPLLAVLCNTCTAHATSEIASTLGPTLVRFLLARLDVA